MRPLADSSQFSLGCVSHTDGCDQKEAKEGQEEQEAEEEEGEPWQEEELQTNGAMYRYYLGMSLTQARKPGALDAFAKALSDGFQPLKSGELDFAAVAAAAAFTSRERSAAPRALNPLAALSVCLCLPLAPMNRLHPSATSICAHPVPVMGGAGSKAVTSLRS